jgi:hypothetical protein
MAQLKLRTFGPIRIFLLVLWSLSPLGGQASLQVISVETAINSRTVTLGYMGTYYMENNFTIEGADNANVIRVMDLLFAASLLAPSSIKEANMDLWGNIKIPAFESLSGYAEDEAGWKSVPESPNGIKYPSLVGIPLLDILDVELSGFGTLDEPDND